MSKEVKFYLALTLIGLCISGAVFFYFNIETSEIVDAVRQSRRKRGAAVPQMVRYYNNKREIIFMCLCLIPILPLFFFAKNNRP